GLGLRPGAQRLARSIEQLLIEEQGLLVATGAAARGHRAPPRSCMSGIKYTYYTLDATIRVDGGKVARRERVRWSEDSGGQEPLGAPSASEAPDGGRAEPTSPSPLSRSIATKLRTLPARNARPASASPLWKPETKCSTAAGPRAPWVPISAPSSAIPTTPPT